jgi:aryl-alcohol dehydrogenase-like predicted oxidoreductase
MTAARLGLGTVQWGMPYGIANESGTPTADDVTAILADAKTVGVNLLDTAWAYGAAESVLGTQGVLSAGFQVVTKTTPLKGANSSTGDLADIMERGFDESLNRLNGSAVYGLLVHHADDLLGHGGDALWARMESLRSAGMVGKIGCSAYKPEQLALLLERYPLALVQLPYNIYDQRYVTSGLAAEVKSRGIEVHVRSAFLQGLILMPPGRLSEFFSPLRQHHAAFHGACDLEGVTPLQAALRYCMDCPEVDRVIVGCERPAQWREIIAAASTPLPEGFCQRISKFALDDEDYLNPTCWMK